MEDGSKRLGKGFREKRPLSPHSCWIPVTRTNQVKLEVPLMTDNKQQATSKTQHAGPWG